MADLDNLRIERGIGLEEARLKFEKWYVWWALEKNEFNQSKAAEELKTHRNNLVRRLSEWGWTETLPEGYPGRKVTLHG